MPCGPGCTEHEHGHLHAPVVTDDGESPESLVVPVPSRSALSPSTRRVPVLLSARLRGWVALGFLLLWAALLVWDATSDLWDVRWDMPLWLQAVGVVVLSYVLGIKLPLLVGHGSSNGHDAAEGAV